MKNFTEHDVLQTIRKEIEGSSLRKVAELRGIDPAMLSRVLSGQRNVSDAVAAAFGYERVEVVSFRKKAA